MYVPIYLDDVGCTGQETELLECPSLPLGVHNCRHSEDVRITCHDGVYCPAIGNSIVCLTPSFLSFVTCRASVLGGRYSFGWQ